MSRDDKGWEIMCQQELRQKRGGMMPPLGIIEVAYGTLL
jgi:hypothetical protein